MSKKIAIGGDHAGFEYKQRLIDHLQKQGYAVEDFGPGSDASVDYPDHAHPLSEAVANKRQDLGILICGSGNGVCMTANKHQGIRAGLCWNEEVAALIRQHNNANVLCIPARFVEFEQAVKITDTFLTTEFEGGRHGRRVDKIAC
ncbi:ribose 5-phosphate isomerase B [Cesiribacter sp. SM1]|uniref:ribose 5-phosphate isomerase B n=1 Tax=Cesiribacter sp. SM1 TaxID=2861196 RepID=UPI001CD2ECF3|nr:ribose 5-phosphate isomerase B [Cesiribacter sp. SM1]